MQNREFENKVQQKMEELKLSPADALWNKIEAELPEKKPRRRVWVFFIFAALLIFCGTLVFINKQGVDKKNIADTKTQSLLQTDTIAATYRKVNTAIAETTTAKNTTVIKTKETAVSTTAGKPGIAISSSAATTIKSKQPQITAQDDNSGDPSETKNILKTIKGKYRIKITSPAATTGDITILTDEAKHEDQLLYNQFNKTLLAEAIRILPQQNTVLAKPLFTFIPAPLNEQAAAEKKKTNKSTWRYGLLAGVGTSGIVTKSSFTNYFNNSTLSAGGGSPTLSQRAVNNNTPQTNTSWQFGFYAEKKIRERWHLFTAFNYTRQANSIKVGKKVDTTFNVNFDVNKSFEATNYYQPGSNEKYINNYHLLELPLALQYKLLKKLPLYIDAGAAPGILLSSNALVYSNSSQLYVTSQKIFNKVMLSVNAGAVIDINAKKQFPFSIGYSFRYGVSSVVKSSFGKQHFTNSMLYIKIPLKK